MKFWTLHDIAETVPEELDEVIEPVLDIVQAYQRIDGFPKLVRIGRSGDDDNTYRYVVDLELASGILLPTEYGLLELIEEGHYDDEDHGEALAKDLEEGLLACYAQLPMIEELLHDSRMRVRKVMGRWTGAAQAVRLIQVRLAPHDNWRGGTPEVQVLIDGLDYRLQPEVAELGINEYRDIEADLEGHRRLFERRLTARSWLARRGATGTIDQLAVNAISRFADVGETLRRFGSEWRIWLPDDTAVLMRDGHVSIGWGSPSPSVEFASDHVNIRGLFLPKTELESAIGRPANEVFEHEFLNARMTVSKAISEIQEGVPWTTLVFDQPQFLFCSHSGRTWEAEAADETPESSTVTPFLRCVK